MSTDEPLEEDFCPRDMLPQSDLTDKQERALMALLIYPSVPKAAKAAGIGERTLYRWLAECYSFQQSVSVARRAMLSQSLAGLHHAADDTIQALRQIVTDEKAPPATRVSAAKTLLDYIFKGAALF